MDATIDKPVATKVSEAILKEVANAKSDIVANLSSLQAAQGPTAKFLLTLHRNLIHPASWGNQRKRKRNPQKFAEFRADIRTRGIDTPLQVRFHPTIPGEYELLAGYGRFEVAELENIEDVPVVLHSICDDTQAKLIMASENLQREDLHPVDAANAAASMLADLGGDMEALESVTNWSQSRLKKYFQLLRCTPKVQAAIDIKQESGFTLTLGHANELSALPDAMQDKICDAVLDKKMSVKDLRSFIKVSLERPLCEAIFDKSDCSNCKFNKVTQTDLFFESSNTGAICTNVSCFKEKTQNHLEQRLESLKADHGNIIFLSTAGNNVTPVSAMVVGKDKYENNCLSCTKYTALLVDDGSEIDTVRESYCMDLECAKIKGKQVKSSTTLSVTEKEAQKQAEAEQETSKKAKKRQKNETATAKAKNNKDDQKVESNEDEDITPTSGVVNDARDFLQEQFGPKLQQHETFSYALMLHALQKLRGEFGISQENIVESMKETPEKLSEMVHDEISFIINQTKGDNRFNGQAMAILAGNTMPEAVAEAKRAWKPTEENLNSMRLSLIQQVLTQSGFKAAFIERFGDKAWIKLTGLRKSDQIKTILDIEFDWTDYTPTFVDQFIQ
ncbi:ParB/RepB/Spo0J family partition protein [Vibrio parahaemolyticus]|nr:ParB/RepB/Spo0J family partition protein [Vibrio parahaemolyticus]